MIRINAPYPPEQPAEYPRWLLRTEQNAGRAGRWVLRFIGRSVTALLRSAWPVIAIYLVATWLDVSWLIAGAIVAGAWMCSILIEIRDRLRVQQQQPPDK